MLCLLLAASAWGGTTFEVVAPLGRTFTDPYYPVAGLIQATDGAFYGTTKLGGSNNFGTIIRVTMGGASTNLFSFANTNGEYPQAPLFQAQDGNMYGTTYYGGTSGAGTVFRISTNGSFTNLASFELSTSGAWPQGALVDGLDGKLYGTTTGGGPTSQSSGTVFSLGTNGAIATIASFTNGGLGPWGGLILAKDGYFYGTTHGGGVYNLGTVFKLSFDGTLVTLCSFSGTNGAGPVGELAQGWDGNFYGTTTQGITNYSQSNPGHGTVFRVTPGGDLTNLAVFQGSNGANPNAGLALASDGNFYGCTSGGGDLNDGVVFRISPGGNLTRIYSMSGTSGSLPYSRLVQGSDGRIYGTLAAGGPIGSGNIFRLGLPLAATQTVQANGHDVLIGWNAVVGQSYQIQYTSASSPTSWTNLGGLITATNNPMIIKDSIVYGSIGKLYRVVSSY